MENLLHYEYLLKVKEKIRKLRMEILTSSDMIGACPFATAEHIRTMDYLSLAEQSSDLSAMYQDKKDDR